MGFLMENELKKSYLGESSIKKLPHPSHPPFPLYFNDSSVKETCKKKHPGMLLDFRLDFQEYWKYPPKKINNSDAY